MLGTISLPDGSTGTVMLPDGGFLTDFITIVVYKYIM
jgi:hypothetical protein